MPYQNSSSEIFLKCGQIKQKYVPPIDVGYACCFADNETVLTYLGHDQFHFNNMNLNIDSYNGLLHNELGNLLNSSFISLLILLPENNFNSTSAVIGRYNNDSKLYSGQTVFVLPLKWYEESNYKVSAFPSGYPFHYNSQFLVPNIETTLRLKANDKVQRFKTTNSSEGTDIYTIDLREMNNGHVGCHAVPDNITHPGFKDFYEKRYKTNLLMFDEKTDKYLEVYDIKSLVSNSKYKCVINVDTITSDNKKPKFIKETNFTISFSNESSFTTWIIIGVSVSIISLLVIGLIIYKKLKPRKIESDNTPSIGISTPTSTSKSSTVTTSVVNAPIIQNKKVAPLSNSIGKKIVTKNSNINANNQMKKVTNKTVAKKSNVKQICEDSVFQMK
uniref:Ig-like domain-containing protein n=1 Tax=Strongyloides papillosus TaxID=174720 RepID=A0A0N5C017_STREA